jgi:predicted lipid-binding transport protein (Tim44 family)
MMKKYLLMLFAGVMSLSLIAFEAEAKRFGGGGNVGQQRNSMSRQATPQKAAPAPAAAPAPSGASKWLGPLAGLAAGGLLASMFMGGGLGGGMMNMLMIALLVGGAFFVFRMLRRPKAALAQQPMQYAGMGNAQPEPMSFGGGAAAPMAQAAIVYPEGFDAEGFLRQAKTSFIRLQAAYDAKDINDIRTYTTPEMFAEISMQIRERGDAAQQTDVVKLDAEILDVVTEGEVGIVSVRFHGLIREQAGAAAEAFDETWHVQRYVNDPKSSWLISGIQQA